MRKFLLLSLLALSGASFAQTTHVVTVASNSFTPGIVTVEVGDTVRWVNTQGSHNVNGTQGAYPTNPEGFGNSVGSGWTYDFVFTIPGSYDYRCDPHFTLGMEGRVIVNQPQSILDKTPLEVKLSPVPANDFVMLDLSFADNNARAEVLSLDGKTVLTQTVNNGRNTINLSGVANGVYFVRTTSNDRVITKRLIVK